MFQCPRCYHELKAGGLKADRNLNDFTEMYCTPSFVKLQTIDTVQENEISEYQQQSKNALFEFGTVLKQPLLCFDYVLLLAVFQKPYSGLEFKKS